MFDPLDELEAAIDKLGASEASVDVLRLTKLSERLEYQRLRAVAAFDRSGAWLDVGCLSAASYLRHRGRMTHGNAAASVSLARRLEALPETLQAFAAGEIDRHHARAIADACTRERAPAIHEVEAPLMTVARRVDAREFRSMLSTFTDALDGDGGAAAAEVQHERRRLHVSELLDGMVAIDGLLDAESGAIVRTALERAIDPPTLGDGRAPAQRRADALVRVVRSVGSGTRVRPRSHASAERHVCRRCRGARATLRSGAGTASAGRSRAWGSSLGRDLAPDLVRRRHRPSHHRWTHATARRRPHDPHGGTVAVACPRRSRRRLRCSRMRSPAGMVRRAPPAPLGRRRRDCARQPRTPLPATPSRQCTKARRPRCCGRSSGSGRYGQRAMRPPSTRSETPFT